MAPELPTKTCAACRRLAARGEVLVLQGGRPVEPSRARGPIRLERGPGYSDQISTV